jgi:hypothetical protein
MKNLLVVAAIALFVIVMFKIGVLEVNVSVLEAKADSLEQRNLETLGLLDSLAHIDAEFVGILNEMLDIAAEQQNKLDSLCCLNSR